MTTISAEATTKNPAMPKTRASIKTNILYAQGEKPMKIKRERPYFNNLCKMAQARKRKVR